MNIEWNVLLQTSGVKVDLGVSGFLCITRLILQAFWSHQGNTQKDLVTARLVFLPFFGGRLNAGAHLQRYPAGSRRLLP